MIQTPVVDLCKSGRRLCEGVQKKHMVTKKIALGMVAVHTRWACPSKTYKNETDCTSPCSLYNETLTLQDFDCTGD